MGLNFKKLADPSGFLSGETSNKSMFDPGSQVLGVFNKKLGAKAGALADPAGIFNDPLAPPASEPGDLTAAFRRPIQERLVTDLFAGVAGPTQAITDMRRKKLKSQRGIAASSGSISAAARTLLVGSTGKSSEEFAAEAKTAERLARREEFKATQASLLQENRG